MRPMNRLADAAPRLARRAPFPALALALCLAFAIVGIAVLDDYGYLQDEWPLRSLAVANVDYFMGDSGRLFSHANRFYGVAFELPLLFIERVLGLEDSRDILLMRHLATHLFFILGAFFGGLLAYRMFGSRALALLAMLLFLLHPRLYAHSFINTKDLPFAAMFMIALFLAHRAFRRGTPSAFALCGIGIGLGIGMRPFGLLLLAAVLGMRALDLCHASDGSQRRRILGTTGAFTAASLAMAYAAHPYHWTNPLQYFNGLQKFASRFFEQNLFQGELWPADALPLHYIPAWFAISSPPLTLLLGMIGALAIGWRGVARMGEIARNGELRFAFLLLGCTMLPVVIVILMQSAIYDGWRHFYFLWAPFSLLAAGGLHWLLGRRTLIYGMAGAGLVVVAAEMALLHPNQQVYFNFLVDRKTPGALAEQYDMDYWGLSHRQALEHLLERHDRFYVQSHGNTHKSRRILPKPERQRVLRANRLEQTDFHVGNNLKLQLRAMPAAPVIHARQAYGSNIFSIVAPKLVWGRLRPDAETYRAAYRSLIAAGDKGRIARAGSPSAFDVHLGDGALFYVREHCHPADAEARFFLHLFPVDLRDLPALRRKHGFDNRNFFFAWRGGHFDGKCMTQAPLPEYPIARIQTGQFRPGEGQIWKLEFEPS